VHELIAQERDRAAAVRGMQRFSASGGGKVVGKVTEFMARRKDGTTFPVEIAVAALYHGGQWCAVGSIRDITTRKLAEEQLRQMAITDSLTRASNRRHFMELAARELERSRRYGRQFSLIMLDIDLFKNVNDTHGHDTGDQVLVTFVEQARMELRQNDLLARFGGEEFVALLPETDLVGAGNVAERIRRRMEALRIENGAGKTVRFTVSAGVAGYSRDIEDMDSLLKLADTALYKAKDLGRNRVQVLAG
jgi:diguanylate cyclase (GGDEF)-like protein